MTHCLPPFHLTPIYLPLVIKCELSNRQGNEGKTGENGDQKSPKTARILREDVSSVQRADHGSNRSPSQSRFGVNSKDAVAAELVETSSSNSWRTIEKGTWIFFKFYKSSTTTTTIDDAAIVEDC